MLLPLLPEPVAKCTARSLPPLERSVRFGPPHADSSPRELQLAPSRQQRAFGLRSTQISPRLLRSRGGTGTPSRIRPSGWMSNAVDDSHRGLRGHRSSSGRLAAQSIADDPTAGSCEQRGSIDVEGTARSRWAAKLAETRRPRPRTWSLAPRGNSSSCQSEPRFFLRKERERIAALARHSHTTSVPHGFPLRTRARSACMGTSMHVHDHRSAPRRNRVDAHALPWSVSRARMSRRQSARRRRMRRRPQRTLLPPRRLPLWRRQAQRLMRRPRSPPQRRRLSRRRPPTRPPPSKLAMRSRTRSSSIC